jgi:uncharacterized protein
MALSRAARSRMAFCLARPAAAAPDRCVMLLPSLCITSVTTHNMYIYLHGFNSGGTSSKAGQLCALLAPIPLLAPTYPAHKAAATVSFLRDYIATAIRQQARAAPLVLIGSSLGGFYAQTLARDCDARIALINPSIYPDETLMSRVGRNRNEATGEHYDLTTDDVRALGHYRVPACNPGVPTLLLLDAGDELLDYRIAEAWYRGCGKTIVYAGGSHRFEHLADAALEIQRLHDT